MYIYIHTCVHVCLHMLLSCWVVWYSQSCKHCSSCLTGSPLGLATLSAPIHVCIQCLQPLQMAQAHRCASHLKACMMVSQCHFVPCHDSTCPLSLVWGGGTTIPITLFCPRAFVSPITHSLLSAVRPLLHKAVVFVCESVCLSVGTEIYLQCGSRPANFALVAPLPCQFHTPCTIGFYGRALHTPVACSWGWGIGFVFAFRPPSPLVIICSVSGAFPFSRSLCSLFCGGPILHPFCPPSVYSSRLGHTSFPLFCCVFTPLFLCTPSTVGGEAPGLACLLFPGRSCLFCFLMAVPLFPGCLFSRRCSLALVSVCVMGAQVSSILRVPPP